MTDYMKMISVVKISEDQMSLVLNVGKADGINPGQRFLIYSEGEELFDPVSNESLGRLEVVRGTGKATHVQEKMTTVRSDAKSEATRTIRRTRNDNFGFGSIGAFAALMQPTEIEEVMPNDSLPFDSPKAGDKARLI